MSSSDLDLISRVTDYVREYMSHYDASHDFKHIQRVLALSVSLASSAKSSEAAYNLVIVKLAALLHDVGDRKYLLPGQDSTTLVREVLLSLGADSTTASTVQAIASAVSYSSEVKDPEKVLQLLAVHPELGVVQDADRLDAIGAVGIARCFTFGGAKGGKDRGLSESVDHFTEKLEKLEEMMKTDAGRDMARVRTERLKVYRGWWEEEMRETSGENLL